MQPGQYGFLTNQIEIRCLDSSMRRFRIGKESCSIEKTSQIPEKSIGIQDLTKILFGFEHLELLSRYPDFEAIEPLGPVMIGEII